MAKLVFYRSKPALLGGVCAGIARYGGFDVVTVRILALLLCFCSLGLAGVAYIVICFTCPKEEPEQKLIEVEPLDFCSEFYGKKTTPSHLRNEQKDKGKDREELVVITKKHRPLLGVSLVGLYALTTALLGLILGELVEGVAWYDFWPLIFVMGSLAYLVVPNTQDSLGIRFAVGLPVMACSLIGLTISLGFLSSSSAFSIVLRSNFFLIPYAVILVLGIQQRRFSFVLAAGLIMAAGIFFVAFVVGTPGDTQSLAIHLGKQFISLRNPWIS